MLLFIYQRPLQIFQFLRVSIHQMLLFITTSDARLGDSYLFPYIKCYCLSGQELPLLSLLTLFPYIKFYCLSQCDVNSHGIYIVSIHQMLLFIISLRSIVSFCTCFHTSNVIVYRIVHTPPWAQASSFHTSNVIVYPISALLAAVRKLCFHTSNVIVYRVSNTPSSRTAYSFHTSNVIVYRFIGKSSCYGFSVSIHQMLLFISTGRMEEQRSHCFHTSNVIVYRLIQPTILQVVKVSIHQMLLFIIVVLSIACAISRFHTSNVIVYQRAK